MKKIVAYTEDIQIVEYSELKHIAGKGRPQLLRAFINSVDKR